MKKYQKPAVTTIEIPERTAYACNLHYKGCPHLSSLVSYSMCASHASLQVTGGHLGHCK